MIGGTSTGGCVFPTAREGDNITDSPRLMAIMLGRLRMDIDECIDAYVDLFDRVFKKKRHPVTFRGKIQDRFDTKEQEDAIKEIVFQRCGQQKGSENALLRDGDSQNVRCKVYDGLISGSVWHCWLTMSKQLCMRDKERNGRDNAFFKLSIIPRLF
jgi:hypothetical protein